MVISSSVYLCNELQTLYFMHVCKREVSSLFPKYLKRYFVYFRDLLSRNRSSAMKTL